MSEKKKLKIVINENGDLVLNRAGKLKIQHCRFGSQQENCGDDCPLFNEPVIGGRAAAIEICRDSLWCETVAFEDRREQG